MIRISLLAILFSSLILTSCKNGTTGLFIPKDAAVVLDINGSSLSSKISWSDLQKTDWFKDIYSHTEDSLSQKMLIHPDSSGIDIKSHFGFFIKKQNNGGYLAFEGNIKDPNAFEAMVKKMNHDAKTQIDGGINFITTGNSSIVSWNSSKFIFLSDFPLFGVINAFGGRRNGMNSSFTPDSLKLVSKELFNISSSNNIESDDHYTSLIKESGDIHFYMNLDQYISSMSGGMFSMLKVNSLLEGNVSTATLNFEDGKINLKTRTYYGRELTAILNKYDFKPISSADINRIPSKNVVAAFGLSIPPDAIKEILKASGMDGMANAFLSEKNYSLDELLQAIRGQMVIAMTDLTMKPLFAGSDTIPGSHVTSIPDVKILYGIAINNKNAFDKLLNIIKGEIKDSSVLSKISMKENNGWFAISNSPQLTDGFLTATNNNLSFTDKISGHTFGAYVDIQKILKIFQTSIRDSSAIGIMNASINMWQDAVITGGQYKNGVSNGDITVNLVDKSTNSLKQINSYAEFIYNAHKKHIADIQTPAITDSTVVAPPVTLPEANH